jgi:hypothetical protein
MLGQEDIITPSPNLEDLEEEKKSQLEEKNISQEILGFANRLNSLATFLQFFTVSFALAAMVFSLLVATFTDDPKLPIKLLAFFSAVFTSIYTGFRLRTKAASVRDAYRYLKTELYRYRAGIIELPALIQAYSHAEKLVGHIEVDALNDRSSDEASLKDKSSSETRSSRNEPS